MRYKIDDESPEKPEEPEASETNLLLSLKNVEDLPEDMKELVSINAAHLSQSLQDGADRAVKDLETKGEDIDQLAAILTPFVMELAYLKINIAALSTKVAELSDGKSD
jgi:hypothetical protein